MSGLIADPLITMSSANDSNSVAGSEGTYPTRAIAFRFRADRPLGDIVADFELRPQEMTVRVDTEVAVGTTELMVTQTMLYHVRYRPATRLAFDVPQALYQRLTNPRYFARCQLALGGRSITIEELLGAANGTASRGLVTLVLPLREPLMGSATVKLQFPWPVAREPNQRIVDAPLIAPHDGHLLSNTAIVSSNGSVQVTLVEDALWTVEGGSAATAPLVTEVSAPGRTYNLRLRFLAPERQTDVTTQTIVQRAWLQTWLTHTARLDRAVFQIEAGGEQVQFDLPDDVDLARMVSLVDGVAVAGQLSENQLLLPLPETLAETRTIELSLPYNGRPPNGSFSVQRPRVTDARPATRWFWQLILPSDEYLLSHAPQIISSNRWQWHRGWFVPQQEFGQRFLESWTHATEQPEPPAATHRYLFTSFEPAAAVRVTTCGRNVLAYTSSFALLGFGLGLWYVPLLRRPPILIVLAVALLASSWHFLPITLVVAQASVSGLLAIVVATTVSTTLRWLLLRPRYASARRLRPERTTERALLAEPHSTASAAASPLATGASHDSTL